MVRSRTVVPMYGSYKITEKRKKMDNPGMTGRPAAAGPQRYSAVAVLRVRLRAPRRFSRSWTSRFLSSCSAAIVTCSTMLKIACFVLAAAVVDALPTDEGDTTAIVRRTLFGPIAGPQPAPGASAPAPAPPDFICVRRGSPCSVLNQVPNTLPNGTVQLCGQQSPPAMQVPCFCDLNGQETCEGSGASQCGGDWCDPTTPSAVTFMCKTPSGSDGVCCPCCNDGPQGSLGIGLTPLRNDGTSYGCNLGAPSCCTLSEGALQKMPMPPSAPFFNLAFCGGSGGSALPGDIFGTDTGPFPAACPAM